jgi:hypothetical protein
MNTAPILTPEEEKFIRDNYAKMSVPKMAKELKRASASLYPWLEKEGLTPFRQDKKPHNHPFRKRNRQLEAFITYAKESRTVIQSENKKGR